MGGYLDEKIYDGAGHLYHKGCYKDAPHEVGHMGGSHYVIAQKIRKNGYHIRNGAPLAAAQLYERPALIAPVETDKGRRKKYREQIEHQQQEQLVGQGQQAEVTEDEKNQKA